jgi:protein gp37
MGAKTGIAWCDATFNPWWGCTKVSPGCANCYAEALSKRYGHDVWGPTAGRRVFDDRHWLEPEQWNRAAANAGVQRRVFCGSMCDFLEENPLIDGQRERLWDLIQRTPNLIWLLLTKRAERIDRHIPRAILEAGNVMIGVSVEDQQRADERIPLLLGSWAANTFLSCEPLLGEVRLGLDEGVFGTCNDRSERLGWVIVGGESQPGCRPMDLTWAAGLVGECKDAEVPVFVKQLGGHPDKRAHPEAWPEELRVQEFPRL